MRRVLLYLRFWLRPLRCPDCGLRCLSEQGLGRHRAAHGRKTQGLPLRVESAPKCSVEGCQFDVDVDGRCRDHAKKAASGA